MTLFARGKRGRPRNEVAGPTRSDCPCSNVAQAETPMPHAACFRKPRLGNERVSDDRTATPFFIAGLHAKICKSGVLSLVVQTA